jgi:hypothetical protein
MSRRVGVLCAAVALVALTACGPTTHDHLDLRNVTTDVVYGGQTKTLPPVPGATLEPGFPSFIQAPIVPTRRPVNNVVAEVCPQAPFSVEPAIKATPNVLKPPAKGDYVFRMDGHSTFRGVDTIPGVELFRRVENSVDHKDGTFSFDVLEAQPGQQASKTTYIVDQRTGLAQYDGIFIAAVGTLNQDGSIDVFQPTPAIRILPLPAEEPLADGSNYANVNWESAGTDGVHNITEEIFGTITKPGRVDACGTVLGGWEVHATGRILSPTKNIAIDTTYTIATQFGGLSISDHLNLDGIDGGQGADEVGGAQCVNSTGSVDNAGAPDEGVGPQHAEQPAPCPGGVLHRQTEAVIMMQPHKP